MTSLLMEEGSSQDRHTHRHAVALRRASGLCDMPPPHISIWRYSPSRCRTRIRLTLFTNHSRSPKGQADQPKNIDPSLDIHRTTQTHIKSRPILCIACIANRDAFLMVFRWRSSGSAGPRVLSCVKLSRILPNRRLQPFPYLVTAPVATGWGDWPGPLENAALSRRPLSGRSATERLSPLPTSSIWSGHGECSQMT